MRLFRATGLMCTSFVLVAADPQAWIEAPAMTADPAALLAYSATHPPRKDAKILEFLHERRVSFDAQGLKTQTLRHVYRLDHPSDFDGWDRVNAYWAPWYEERTQIRARVISPDGKVTVLDPATIGEYGAEDESSDVYGDRKGLRAPLPQVSQGAIVELEFVDRERSLPMKGGATGSLLLSQWVPVLNTRVLLEAPETLPLRWKLHGKCPVQPQKTVAEGRVTLRIAYGSQESLKGMEPHMAPDQDPRVWMQWSTSRDWNALAAEYHGIVEAQIQGAGLEAWAREAIGDAKDADSKIARILARLHREVRYTGIEFGDAALVPRKPQETLTRGYGDCKDKASLLVAALRSVGIPAQVALLRAGSGQDMDPELPGYGFFNHAITFLPGPKPRWIDATAEYARLGELPLGDCGRLALVAEPGTRSLLSIPPLDPLQNRVLETRVYRLVDGGPAQVQESTELWGPQEMGFRSGYANRDQKQVRESLAGYVKNTYSAKNLGKVTHSDPRDLSKPFKLEFEVLEPGTAATDTDSASVSVNFWPMVKKLNEVLHAHQEAPAEEEAGEEAKPEQAAPGQAAPEPAAGEKPKAVRKTDLILPEPEVVDFKVQILPPLGYAVDSMPAALELAFGPATFKVEWRANAKGELEASARLHTVKQRWTAAEVNQGAAALDKYGESKVPVVTFKMLGEAHLEADRIKEALGEFRKLVATEPAKASHHTRIARALLQAGLGEAARKQAEEAIRLEPTSSLAQATLGWILQHDLLGRRFGPGWDAAGCEKAYLKAKELDPANHIARYDLAIMLEHDEDGQRYSPRARMGDAIREYQALRKDWKHEALDNNLLVALARAGRLEESLTLIRDLEPTPFRNRWRVILVTCLKNAEEGLQEAVRLFPDTQARRGALESAGETLLHFRRYAEASRFMLEGAAGSEELGRIRARAEFLARLKPVDITQLDPKDPRTVVKRFVAEILRGQLTKKGLEAFLSPALAATADEEEGGLPASFRLPAQVRELPHEFLVDAALSGGQFNLEGDDARGYRILADLVGGERTLYVARHEKDYRIIGFRQNPECFGWEALWQLEHGHFDQACAALDRAREILTLPGEDPLGGAPFARLWTKGRKPSAEMTTWAAASLLVWERQGTKALALLKEARAKTPEEGQRLKYELAMARACETHKDFALMEALSARLLAAHPDSKSAARLRVTALGGLDRWAEANRFLTERTQEGALEEEYLEMFHLVWGHTGRRAELEKALERSIEQGTAHPGTYNNLAWSQVVRGVVTDRTLEFARKSTEKERLPYNLHTLATVLAELGRTREACREIHSSAEMSSEGIRSSDWYVFGRIAEHLGETEASRACYQRIKPGRTEWLEGDGSCYELAKRRLAILGK